MHGIVFDIQPYAIYDGPGIRTTVYLKGCPLRCAWCHNPESQRFEPEWMARPKNRELVGAAMSVDAVVEKVLADRPFFEKSGGGVTLSGGEPTAQPDFALALLRRFRAEKIHTAIETCGLFPTALLADLVDLVDVFLFDLKHPDAKAHRSGTRADNLQILRNFAAIVAAAGSARVTPRLPLIPGFNADAEAVGATLQFLAAQGYQGDVHLMPHHGWARDKYEALGRGNDYHDAGDVPAATLDALARLVENHGCKAVCYG